MCERERGGGKNSKKKKIEIEGVSLYHARVHVQGAGVLAGAGDLGGGLLLEQHHRRLAGPAAGHRPAQQSLAQRTAETKEEKHVEVKGLEDPQRTQEQHCFSGRQV